MSSYATKPITPEDAAGGSELPQTQVEGSKLPWTQVEPRKWQWRSEDGMTLLRVSQVGMECERSFYAYRNAKLAGSRKDLDEAKALAESGESDVDKIHVADLPGVDDLDAIPEPLRMTPQQRAAYRARHPARPSLDPRLSGPPKTPPAKSETPRHVIVVAQGPVDVVSEDLDLEKGTGAPARISGKLVDAAVISVQKSNPRKEGSAGYKHYEQMRGGVTVREYVGRFRSEKDKKTARQWLSNTIRDGYATLSTTSRE